MSRHAFKRLGIELTELLDDYEASAGYPGKFPNPTMGEHYFVFHVYNYLAAFGEPMTVGFAQLLQVLTEATLTKRWTHFDFRNGRVETDVIHDPDSNRFVRIAHGLMEMEVYNTRVGKESTKLMIVLNLCTECGKVVVSDRGSVSYLCSSSCRVANNRGKYMDVNGQKPNGRATWVRWAKDLARKSADSALNRMFRECDPEKLACVFGAGPLTDMHHTDIIDFGRDLLDIDLEWVMNWVSPFNCFDIQHLETAGGLKEAVARDAQVTEFVEALQEEYAKDPSSFRNKICQLSRKQIRELDPANPWGYAAGSEDTSVRARRFTDKTTPSAVKYTSEGGFVEYMWDGKHTVTNTNKKGEETQVTTWRSTAQLPDLKEHLGHTDEAVEEITPVTIPTLEVRHLSGPQSGLVDLIALNKAMSESTDHLEPLEKVETIAAYSDYVQFFEVYMDQHNKKIEREVLPLQTADEGRRAERRDLLLRLVTLELQRYTELKNIHTKELNRFQEKINKEGPEEVAKDLEFWDVMASVSVEDVIEEQEKSKPKRGRPAGKRAKPKGAPKKAK